MSVRDEDQDRDPMLGYRDGEPVAIASSYGDYSGYYENSKYEYDPGFRVDERRMLSPGAENVPPSTYAGSYVTQASYPGMNNGSVCWQGSPAYMMHATFASMPTQSNGASTGEGIGKTGKSKRRRVPTVAQRRAANIRERRRMFNLNESFDVLRKRVPTFAYEKRLSRIETLRLAMIYIAFMADLVEGKEPKDIKLHSNRSWESTKKIEFQLADDNDDTSS